jgi:hypothetical protein
MKDESISKIKSIAWCLRASSMLFDKTNFIVFCNESELDYQLKILHR